MIGGVTGFVMMLEYPFFSHYVAHLAGLVLLLAIAGLRRLRDMRYRGAPTGLFLSRAIPLATLPTLGVALIASANAWPIPSDKPAGWHITGRGFDNAQRAHILEREPGKHLVFVHYSPDHLTHAEWVWNAADIDASRVVWARELNPAQNQALIKYYKDRQVWVLEADAVTPVLRAVNQSDPQHSGLVILPSQP
jgi:hypothetical protein